MPEKSLADDPTLQNKRYNKELLPLCKCGCGNKVLGYRSEYLRGHKKTTEKLDWNNLPECLCGCGQKVKHPKCKYLSGHWLKKLKKDGKIKQFGCTDAHSRMSPETYMKVCQERSDNMQGNKRWENSSGFTGQTHSELVKNNLSVRAFEQHEDEESKFHQLKPNSGNGKTGNRMIGDKEIWFRSTWEANYARILNHKGIEFIFEPKWFKIPASDQYKETHYVPDFYLVKEDRYVEIKGFIQDDDIYKMNKFVELYNVKLELIDSLKYKELKKEFKDVIKEWE